MRKRGQGLPLNTIILAIIVVLVLVVVVAFFLGGFKGLTRTVKDVFFGTTAGTDESLAIQICNQRCDQAQELPKEQRANSAFCTVPFKIDSDKDGEADIDDKGNYIKWKCNSRSGQPGIKSLNVPCPEVVDECYGQGQEEVKNVPQEQNAARGPVASQDIR